MFDKIQAKRLIVETVEGLQGCKATELAANKNVAINIGQELNDLIEELVADGALKSVEYIVPNLPDRVKLFLFPKGTQITVTGQLG